MTITLYKDVELRNDYSLVFDNDASFWGGKDNTPFYRYLQMKSGITVDVPNIYFANSGNITIDWSYFNSYPTGITYMEIFTETAPNRKYFFVDSYDYNNGMITLYYTMDIWHTYSPSMRLYNGVINRAKHVSGKRHALPTAYVSNLPLNFDARTDATQQTFYLVAEFSVYILQSGENLDNATQRINYTTLVGHHNFQSLFDESQNDYVINAPETVEEGMEYVYTYNSVQKAINQIVAYQGIEPMGYKNQVEKWRPFTDTELNFEYAVFDKFAMYNEVLTPTSVAAEASKYDNQLMDMRYEITQLFLLPTNMFPDVSTICQIGRNRDLNTSLRIQDKFYKYNVSGGGTTITYRRMNFTDYAFYKLQEGFGKILRGYHTVSPNPHVVGVGFHSVFMPLSYNGQIHSFEFDAVFDASGFALSMLTADGIQDITSDFEIPMPYTAPSGIERKIAVLGYQNAKAHRTAQRWTTGIQIGAGMLGMGATGTAAGFGIAARVLERNKKAVGAAATNQKINTNKLVSTILSSSGTTIGQLGALGATTTYGINGLIEAENKLKTPISAGNTTNGMPIGIINAMLGFGTYSISPNNTNEVDFLISRTGYDTFIPTNDYHHGIDSDELKENYYEPIQFATVNVSGGFSNDVRDVLETILLDGTIIAYDEDVFAQL